MWLTITCTVLSSAIRTCIVVAHWLAHAHTAQNKNECAFCAKHNHTHVNTVLIHVE